MDPVVIDALTYYASGGQDAGAKARAALATARDARDAARQRVRDIECAAQRLVGRGMDPLEACLAAIRADGEAT